MEIDIVNVFIQGIEKNLLVPKQQGSWVIKELIYFFVTFTCDSNQLRFNSIIDRKNQFVNKVVVEKEVSISVIIG